MADEKKPKDLFTHLYDVHHSQSNRQAEFKAKREGKSLVFRHKESMVMPDYKRKPRMIVTVDGPQTVPTNTDLVAYMKNYVKKHVATLKIHKKYKVYPEYIDGVGMTSKKHATVQTGMIYYQMGSNWGPRHRIAFIMRGNKLYTVKRIYYFPDTKLSRYEPFFRIVTFRIAGYLKKH